VIIDSNPSTSGSISASFTSFVVAVGAGLGVDLDRGTSNEAGLYPGARLCKSSFLLYQHPVTVGYRHTLSAPALYRVDEGFERFWPFFAKWLRGVGVGLIGYVFPS
jgi:hypothetical protein